ncbi:hypothetical protein cypCar_00044080, partial [Cyprinus carpio]
MLHFSKSAPLKKQTHLHLHGLQDEACLQSFVMTGPDGEHNWSSNYPFCGGAFQSPIDFQTHLLRYDSNLPPIQVQNYNLSTNEQLTLSNNGHSVQLSLPSHMYISSLPYKYSAAQLHFHWGSSNQLTGSEHTVNGKQFAGE